MVHETGKISLVGNHGFRLNRISLNPVTHLRGQTRSEALSTVEL